MGRMGEEKVRNTRERKGEEVGKGATVMSQTQTVMSQTHLPRTLL